MGTPVKNPYSPFKKNIKATKSVQTGHELKVCGFPPTMLELYSYIKYASGSERENYTYSFRKNFDGDDPNFSFPELEEYGFLGYYYMRDSKESNERKNGSDGYPRYMLVRCVPGGNVTSRETRFEGMNRLSNFFSSKKASKYPPASIRLTDETADPPKALDEYLLDKDIFKLLGSIFEEDVLAPTFYSTFPEIAAVLFGGPIYSPEAIAKLGFGQVNTSQAGRGSYAPGFIPPVDENHGTGGNNTDPTDGEAPENNEPSEDGKNCEGNKNKEIELEPTETEAEQGSSESAEGGNVDQNRNEEEKESAANPSKKRSRSPKEIKVEKVTSPRGKKMRK